MLRIQYLQVVMTYQEGYPKRYPSLDQTATFSGHTHRVLYLAMSPDGRTIVTGAGDETLRFWAALPERKDSKRETRIEDIMGRIR